MCYRCKYWICLSFVYNIIRSSIRIALLKIHRNEASSQNSGLNKLFNCRCQVTLIDWKQNYWNYRWCPLDNLQRFNDLYVHFDRTISGLSEIVSVARDHLQQLRLRLNMLSLGHLSPTVIPPGISNNFYRKSQLPSQFKLPYDPDTDLWSYYKILPCTTLIGEEDLVVVLTIALLGASKQFEMFKIYNLPVPNRRTNQSNLLAR